MIKRLLSILALKRGHGSVGEEVFIDRFLMPYEPVQFEDDVTSEVMAFVLTTDPQSRTLFSCHIDTVHRNTGVAPDAVQNHVVYDARQQVAYKDKDDPTPLGADDGAGVWLMLEMYDAGVPGSYIFHRGEERGGIGAKWMADNKPAFPKYFSYAIAFDRRGTGSVITHQGRDQCCSNEFAVALSDALNRASKNLAFSPDNTGIYTDTAEYMGLIPECTNLSCGYDNEHSANETLDVGFLMGLRETVICLRWDELPVVRTPVARQAYQPAVQYANYGYTTKGSLTGPGRVSINLVGSAHRLRKVAKA